MKRSLLAAAAALLMATSAQALFYDGAKMYELCSNERGGRTVCLGYTAGLSEALEVSKVICPHPNVTIGSMADVITRELADHPETRHHSAASIATNALHKAFPCPGRP